MTRQEWQGCTFRAVGALNITEGVHIFAAMPGGLTAAGLVGAVLLALATHSGVPIAGRGLVDNEQHAGHGME